MHGRRFSSCVYFSQIKGICQLMYNHEKEQGHAKFSAAYKDSISQKILQLFLDK